MRRERAVGRCGVEHLPRRADPRRRRKNGRLGGHGPSEASVAACQPSTHVITSGATSSTPSPLEIHQVQYACQKESPKLRYTVEAAISPTPVLASVATPTSDEHVADGSKLTRDDRPARKQPGAERRLAEVHQHEADSRPQTAPGGHAGDQVDRGQHRQHRRPPLARRQQQDGQRQAGRRPDRREHAGRARETGTPGCAAAR